QFVCLAPREADGSCAFKPLKCSNFDLSRLFWYFSGDLQSTFFQTNNTPTPTGNIDKVCDIQFFIFQGFVDFTTQIFNPVVLCVVVPHTEPGAAIVARSEEHTSELQ